METYTDKTNKSFPGFIIFNFLNYILFFKKYKFLLKLITKNKINKKHNQHT